MNAEISAALRGDRVAKLHKHELIPEHYAAHAKPVATMDHAAVIAAMASTDERDRMTYLWYLMWSDDLVVPDGPGRTFVELRRHDLAKLLDSNIVEETTGETNTSVFLVCEHAKKRARVIMWPRRRNDEIARAGYEADMPLKHPTEIAAEMWNCEVMFAVDLTASFYQVSVPQANRSHYRFSCFGKTYRLTRMAMGVRPAAEFMNRLSHMVARPPPHLADDVAVNEHIDNILVTGTPAAVEEMFTILTDRCRKWSVSLNDNPQPSDIGTVQEYCGFVYDATNKTTRMADKMRAKFDEDAWASVETCRDYLRLFSLHIYVARALYLPLAKWYYPLKFARLISKLIA